MWKFKKKCFISSLEIYNDSAKIHSKIFALYQIILSQKMLLKLYCELLQKEKPHFFAFIYKEFSNFKNP